MPKSTSRSFVSAYALFGGAGLQLVISVILGILAGKYIDAWIDTYPLFLIVGFLLGAVAGFVNLYYLVKYADSNKNKPHTEK